MVVTLLLAAGMLALEREEHAFGRLVRGLVCAPGCSRRRSGSPPSAACALASSCSPSSPRSSTSLGRVPPWLPRSPSAALAFAALGVAIGALTREVRAASLLAFMLALPVAAPR